MSERVKIQQARITGGVVEIKQGGEWLQATDAFFLSEGATDSEGAILIGETLALYLTNTQPDAQLIIDKLGELTELMVTLGNSVAVVGSPINAAVALEAAALKIELEAILLI